MANNTGTLLSTPAWRLLVLACLPLVDGYFLFFLRNDPFRGPLGAVIFGLTALSGAGCVGAAMNLTGRLWKRVSVVLLVYLVVTAVALLVFNAREFLDGVLAKANGTFRVSSGIFLIGLGFSITGIRPLESIARWTKYEHIPMHLFLLVLCAAVFLPQVTGETPTYTKPHLSEVLIAIGVGFALTLLGTFLAIGIRFDLRSLNGGAGLSLVMMGLMVLGVRITTPGPWTDITRAIPIVFLGFGLIFGFIRAHSMEVIDS